MRDVKLKLRVNGWRNIEKMREGGGSIWECSLELGGFVHTDGGVWDVMRWYKVTVLSDGGVWIGKRMYRNWD